VPTNISDKDKIAVSRGTVTVACRVPNGIKARLFTMVDVDVQVFGGGIKSIKEPRVRDDVAPVTFKGPGGSVFGMQTPHRVIGGYGLTPGVDADFFEEWLRQNKDHEAVKNKQVWAHEQEASVVSFAKENVDRRSGMEPLVPANEPKEKGDPRRPTPPRDLGRNIGPVITGTGMNN
jgi:hypothetical protein